MPFDHTRRQRLATLASAVAGGTTLPDCTGSGPESTATATTATDERSTASATAVWRGSEPQSFAE